MAVETKTIYGVASVAATFIQYIPYIRDILRGRTKPHMFSWFVWGLPCGIVYAAQLIKGGAAGSWATGATTIFCTVIFVLSLFYGEKRITRLDKISFILALIALAWWAVTDQPLGSVILITTADVLGMVPTIRKSISKPHEETLSAYVTSGLKWILSFLALSSFSLTTWLYPVAMILTNWAVAGLLFLRRRQLA